MTQKRSSPRTLKLMREWGWYYWMVERFTYNNTRVDLYHIIDYIVITPFSTIGVQACGADFSSHVKKLTEEEVDNTVLWLSSPNRKLILIGWRKVKRVRGMKQMIYKPRIAWLYIDKNGFLTIEEKNTDWYGV